MNRATLRFVIMDRLDAANAQADVDLKILADRIVEGILRAIKMDTDQPDASAAEERVLKAPPPPVTPEHRVGVVRERSRIISPYTQEPIPINAAELAGEMGVGPGEALRPPDIDPRAPKMEKNKEGEFTNFEEAQVFINAHTPAQFMVTPDGTDQALTLIRQVRFDKASGGVSVNYHPANSSVGTSINYTSLGARSKHTDGGATSYASKSGPMVNIPIDMSVVVSEGFDIEEIPNLDRLVERLMAQAVKVYSPKTKGPTREVDMDRNFQGTGVGSVVGGRQGSIEQFAPPSFNR